VAARETCGLQASSERQASTIDLLIMCFTFGYPAENDFPIAAQLKDLPPRPCPGHRWAPWHAQISPLNSCLGALLLPVIVYKQMPLAIIAKFINRLWLSYCKKATPCKVSFERMVVGGVIQTALARRPPLARGVLCHPGRGDWWGGNLPIFNRAPK
jgi:hypothetical protein